MSASEPAILSMEEVRRLTTAANHMTPFIERAPLGEAVTERTIRRLCATVDYWHRAAQAGPVRETCSACRQLSAVGFHVPNEIWQAAIPPEKREDIFCVACFASLADRAYLKWDTVIQFFPVSKRTHRESLGGECSTGGERDREDAENWRTLMSEAANDPDHAEMIERATQAFEESQEELRLLRACEDAALTVEAQEEPEERLTAARLQLQAWSDLRAFRARQKGGAG